MLPGVVLKYRNVKFVSEPAHLALFLFGASCMPAVCDLYIFYGCQRSVVYLCKPGNRRAKFMHLSGAHYNLVRSTADAVSTAPVVVTGVLTEFFFEVLLAVVQKAVPEAEVATVMFAYSLMACVRPRVRRHCDFHRRILPHLPLRVCQRRHQQRGVVVAA